MKKTILNIFIVVGFLWTALSGLYMALPNEVKEMIPQMNWFTALLGGGTTGLLSTVAMMFKAQMSKQQVEVNDEINKFAGILLNIVDNFKEIKALYENIEKKVNSLTVETNKENVIYTDMKNELNRIGNLIIIDLKSKLTNPLLDKDMAKMIEGVLNEEAET